MHYLQAFKLLLYLQINQLYFYVDLFHSLGYPNMYKPCLILDWMQNLGSQMQNQTGWVISDKKSLSK